MKKILTTILIFATCSLAQVDSLFNLPKEDEEIYKPRTHEIDLSSRLAKMNDTSTFGARRTNGFGKSGIRSKDSIVQVIMKHIGDLRYDWTYPKKHKDNSVCISASMFFDNLAKYPETFSSSSLIPAAIL